MSNPNLVEIHIEGYPMPIYDDGRATKKPWIIDFNKMKTFDGNGAEINTLSRNDKGEWGFGAHGRMSKLPEYISVEIEHVYIKWLNREIIG